MSHLINQGLLVNFKERVTKMSSEDLGEVVCEAVKRGMEVSGVDTAGRFTEIRAAASDIIKTVGEGRNL